jgi:hypothetical protein
MTNIIFLDIDETINCVANSIRCRQLGLAPYAFEGFSPISIALLKELVTLSDAKIVLSSTWRCHYESDEDCVEEFKTKLAQLYQWDNFPIIGRTPWLSTNRGAEIQQWLDLHHYTNYVIIDDSSDMNENQMNNLVRVDYREGFNFKNFIQCLKLFQVESNFLSMG